MTNIIPYVGITFLFILAIFLVRLDTKRYFKQLDDHWNKKINKLTGDINPSTEQLTQHLLQEAGLMWRGRVRFSEDPDIANKQAYLLIQLTIMSLSEGGKES